MRIKKHQKHYHIMLLPGILLLFVFNVVPMVGIIMAFQRYSPFAPYFGLGSPWVGLDNFEYMFLRHPESMQVVINTVIFAVSGIILNIVVPVIFAVLLNEVISAQFKRWVQTIVYMPNFLSWVIVGAMFIQLFSPTGLVNSLMMNMGVIDDALPFMASNDYFRQIIIGTDIWKNFGYGAVIYIAAIMNIDPTLFEAAEIDGATRSQKIWHVTIPSILPTIILMSTLALGRILSASFDQIFTMYNRLVYATGDVIDTFVYRIGITMGNYHWATTVGLLRSVISMILIIISWTLAKKFAGYRIF